MTILALILALQSASFGLMHASFVNEGGLLWSEVEAQLKVHFQARRDQIREQNKKFG